MSITIELIYDRDCPNVAGTRANLLRGLAEARVPARWTEWERSSREAPAHASQYGSPTVLINSIDVAGQQPAMSDCCRLYEANGGYAGAPPVEIIVSALRREAFRHQGWRRNLLLLPGLSVSLLPKLACPACWPAYTALLTSVGLGFLLNSAYLLALTVAFLGFAVAALMYRASTRNGYGPGLLGALAVVAVAIGKFGWESGGATYGGLAALFAASLWNSWPRSAGCARCFINKSI